MNSFIPARLRPIAAVLPAFVLLTSCFHDGAARTPPDPIPSEAVNASSASPLGRYDPPVVLSFVRERSSSLQSLIDQLSYETLEDNRWSRLYEQMLGIRIQYDWTAESDTFYQKLGFSLATGRIPDVVRVDGQQLRQLSNEGVLQDLTDAYDRFATPLTKRILSQEGTGPFDAATIDGKLMGIPQTGSSIEGAKFLWIRTDWLDTLGLRPPGTMEELLAVSRAFAEQDPDRNGQADTYGLALTQYLWDPVAGIAGFMAGYGAYPNLWLTDAAGKLKFGGIQPEVKAGLEALQRLYRAGQIDSEFSLKDGAKVQADVAAGKIGMLYGEQWSSFWVQPSREKNPRAQWQAFPLVAEKGVPVRVPLPFATNTFFAVRKDYAHPEAIVKLFNLHLEKNWGKTANYRAYYSTPLPVWSLSPVTPAPVEKNLEAYRQLAEARRTDNFSGLNDEAKAIRKNIDAYLSGTGNAESGWGWERTYGESGAFAILDQYQKNRQLLYESFVGSPTATMLEKQSVLNELQIEAYIRIIMGHSLDEFDRFVEEWRKLGGDQITDEVNRWAAERAHGTNATKP